jgi:pyridoxine 4-dehydrogenase
VPYFPLGSAFAGIAKVTEQPEVVSAAASLRATPAQVGLAWLLAHAPNILPIPGTSSLVHLDENVATANVRLDTETMEVLNRLGASARLSHLVPAFCWRGFLPRCPLRHHPESAHSN